MQSSKTHDYLDEFRVVRTLGAGYHAKVLLAQATNGKKVAIKQYKAETATLKTLKHQLSVLQELNHENIVELISVRENAVYHKRDLTVYNCLAIVMEYVGGGELFDFVAETGKFSEKVSRTYFHQLMNSLYYMHKRGYAHRDIKPENILLSDVFVLKLTDFGFSCDLKGKDGRGVLRTKLGTEGYMAPEIPQRQYDGKKVDIFASGVILFIMYAGNPPFEKASVSDPYYRLIRQKRFDVFWQAHSRKRREDYFSAPFKDLIERMLAADPQERPTIQEIAEHPWVMGSICSHSEIKSEFTGRQRQLDAILEKNRAAEEEERKKRESAVDRLGQAVRSEQQLDDGKFIDYYEKEYELKRELPGLEEGQHYDMTIKYSPCMAVARLREFLDTQQIDLGHSDGQQLIGDETEVLRVAKVQDTGKDKIEVTYQYSYEVAGEEFNDSVVLELTLRSSSHSHVAMQASHVEGSQLYFKKAVQGIRHNCFPN